MTKHTTLTDTSNDSGHTMFRTEPDVFSMPQCETFTAGPGGCLLACVELRIMSVLFWNLPQNLVRIPRIAPIGNPSSADEAVGCFCIHNPG